MLCISPPRPRASGGDSSGRRSGGPHRPSPVLGRRLMSSSSARPARRSTFPTWTGGCWKPPAGRFEVKPSAKSTSVSGEATAEKRDVTGSLLPDAERLLAATCQHGRIENQLDQSLDVAFGKDSRSGAQRRRSRQSGTGPPSGSLATQTDDRIDGEMETKRLRAGWGAEYLEHLLGQL